MSDIIEALQAAAREGRLKHLQLAPLDDGFQATYREVGASGYRIATGPDPATVLRKVLGLARDGD